jgi:hypothetical protein
MGSHRHEFHAPLSHESMLTLPYRMLMWFRNGRPDWNSMAAVLLPPVRRDIKGDGQAW